MRDAVDQFRDAMRNTGLLPPQHIEADGKLHRFPTSAARNDKAGWYILYDDGIPAGAFGDWRSGVKGRWHAKQHRKFTPGEVAAHRHRMENMRRQREAEQGKRHKEGAERATAIWDDAPPASDKHPYLLQKGVQNHGLRLHGKCLVAPARDGEVIRSLQFILPDGTKTFLKEGQVSGCYFLLGQPEGVLLIAEGYATAASIHQATGMAVAVAFNAGNLLPVASKLRAQLLNTTFIICADDDAATPGNPGLTKAREAAQAIGASLAIPDFGANRPQGATDFNDLHRLQGLEAVKVAISRAAFSENGTADESDPWPVPEAIVPALKPVPAFNAEALLPPSLRQWVMDEAGRMPCSPDYIAAAMLVALGSIVGARCAIKPKQHDPWLVVPNLWGGIVGSPSEKKSPAWGAALKPLDRLAAKAADNYRASLADCETEKLIYDAKKDAIHARLKAAAAQKGKGDTAEIAKDLRAHIGQAPAQCKLRRYKTNDTTVEKLGELLRDVPGLLVFRDELVGLLASFDREGREGDRAFYLEAWNGNHSFDTDRIGRGHIHIPNLCFSVFGGIQPDKLIVYLEQAVKLLANDGMLQRFQVLVYPDPCPWDWLDRSPDKDAWHQANAIFDGLADFDPVKYGAAPADETSKFPHFHFDDEAQAIFVDWSGKLHRERIPNEENPIIQQHLAKYDKLFPSLALIFHLVDCVAGSSGGPVSKDAALRADAWCEYLEAHARRCYGLLKDGGLRAAQALAAKLEGGKLNSGFTVRDVVRKEWHSLTEHDQVLAAVNLLEDHGWLREEETGGTGPGGGRRTERYHINPAILAKQKPGS